MNARPVRRLVEELRLLVEDDVDRVWLSVGRGAGRPMTDIKTPISFGAEQWSVTGPDGRVENFPSRAEAIAYAKRRWPLGVINTGSRFAPWQPIAKLAESDSERRSAERAAHDGGPAEAIRDFIQRMRAGPNREQVAGRFFHDHFDDVVHDAATRLVEKLAAPIVAEQKRLLEPKAIEFGTGLKGIARRIKTVWSKTSPTVHVGGSEARTLRGEFLYLSLPTGHLEIREEGYPKDPFFPITKHIDEVFWHLVEKLNTASKSIGGKWETTHVLGTGEPAGTGSSAGRGNGVLRLKWTYDLRHPITPDTMLAIVSSY